MQVFYYVSRFRGLALINKEVLLLHVMGLQPFGGLIGLEGSR